MRPPHTTTMSTPTFELDIDWSTLEPDGAFNNDGTPATTRLSGIAHLGRQFFHIEAIEVKPLDENGWMQAVNPSLQDDVDHLFELNGDHSQTTQINHREYLIYLIPFAQ